MRPIRLILVAVVVALTVGALTPAASATSKPPPPRVITPIAARSVKVICQSSLGARISKDQKWVTCPGGRQFRAAGGKIFIFAGNQVLEVDGKVGAMGTEGEFGPGVYDAGWPGIPNYPGVIEVRGPSPGWPGGYDPVTYVRREWVGDVLMDCTYRLSNARLCVEAHPKDFEPEPPGGRGTRNTEPPRPVETTTTTAKKPIVTTTTTAKPAAKMTPLPLTILGRVA